MKIGPKKLQNDNMPVGTPDFVQSKDSISHPLRNMNQPSDIQKLLQLKRNEVPPSGFHENFLQEFQRRQRADLLRRTLHPSIRQVLMERMKLSIAQLRIPALAYASIAALGVTVSAFILIHSPHGRFHPVLTASTVTNNHSYSGNSFMLPVEIPNQRTVGTLPSSYMLEPQPNSYQTPLRF